MYNLNMYTGKETLAVNETRPAYPKKFPSVILLSFHRICQEYSPPVSNT